MGKKGLFHAEGTIFMLQTKGPWWMGTPSGTYSIVQFRFRLNTVGSGSGSGLLRI